MIRGATVRCLDIQSPLSKRNARPYAGKVEIVWGDIRNAEVVARAVQGIDAIVHLAFIIPPKSEQRPAWSETINVGGTWNLLQAALASGTGRALSSAPPSPCMVVRSTSPRLARLTSCFTRMKTMPTIS